MVSRLSQHLRFTNLQDEECFPDKSLQINRMRMVSACKPLLILKIMQSADQIRPEIILILRKNAGSYQTTGSALAVYFDICRNASASSTVIALQPFCRTNAYAASSICSLNMSTLVSPAMIPLFTAAANSPAPISTSLW